MSDSVSPGSFAPDSFSPGPGFWQEFVDRHLEPELPALFQKPCERTLFTPDEVFEVVTRVSDEFRRGGRADALLFCVEHAARVTEIGCYLPRGSDRSLEGWAERVDRQLEGRAFTLIVHSPHLYSFDYWVRVRRFLDGLAEHGALRNDLFETEIFLGRYRVTPQGVHTDGACTLGAVVAGEKRMLVWPKGTFDRSPDLRSPRTVGGARYIDSLEYGAHRQAAIELHGEPGDLLYFPGSWWHVGESDGGAFTATAYVSILRDRAPDLIAARLLQASVVEKTAAQLARQVLARQDPSGAPSRESVEPFPDEAPPLTEQLEALLPRLDLERRSGARFATVPMPLDTGPLSVRQVVRFCAESLVLWEESPDGYLVAVNGHSFVLPREAEAGAVIEDLRDGRPIRIRELLDQYATVPVACLRQLIDNLLRLRALSVMSP